MKVTSISLKKYLRLKNYYLFCLWKFKIAQSLIHGKRVTRNLRRSHQKALFLDCGSNIGQGFEFFRKFYPLDFFDFVLFEPNPYCFRILENKYAELAISGVTLMNVAVGNCNSTIDFYGLEESDGGVYSVGGSILREHNSKTSTTYRMPSIKVESIDFTQFLSRLITTKGYKTIILKLDIEGGEYQILDSLEKNNMLGIFETLYIEFHSQYMSDNISLEYQRKEKRFLEISKQRKNRVIKWV